MKDLLIEQGKYLLETGYYNKAAYKFAEALDLKMYIKGSVYKKHFPEDTERRHVFKIQLKKDKKQFTFQFGQSISEGSNEPTLYDVLSCLQKYDVGSFEDFCSEFGYEEDETAEKVYKAVVKEFENMERLFSEEELEILGEMQKAVETV